MKKASTHGGAGRGQGRKPGPLPIKLGIKVAADVRDYLKHVKAIYDAAKKVDPQTTENTISDQIDADIRSSKGFKTWTKAQSAK